MLSLIWAEDANHLIGANGQLPWHLPADAKYFRQQTTGHTIIMGKQTWLSIGRPLPKRTNIVLSASLPSVDGVIMMRSLAGLTAYIHDHEEEDLFVIGGVRLYEALLPLADQLLITRIDATFAGDTTMPAIDTTVWQLADVQAHAADEKNQWPYRFETYRRRK
ncbi:dihydrofolate reductase [Furfurilactobacillus siliginis]|uniref:Dihydrofolate reductase n=1 Tax=Furfurilactobacillus siliginis TaxID=348151 RepID=A0A510VP11_9LACO|nr:dihydrofolate reductase [Furfurilactobacillus siliginis]GEK27771.1 dihydrofolate reductase [Furfurilactobacillus siliginis]